MSIRNITIIANFMINQKILNKHNVRNIKNGGVYPTSSIYSTDRVKSKSSSALPDLSTMVGLDAL